MAIRFVIRGETIDLDQLLKATSLVGSGGHAKAEIQANLVSVDGQVETRVRAKLRPGQVVSYGEETIELAASAPGEAPATKERKRRRRRRGRRRRPRPPLVRRTPRPGRSARRRRRDPVRVRRAGSRRAARRRAMRRPRARGRRESGPPTTREADSKPAPRASPRRQAVGGAVRAGGSSVGAGGPSVGAGSSVGTALVVADAKEVAGACTAGRPRAPSPRPPRRRQATTKRRVSP